MQQTFTLAAQNWAKFDVVLRRLAHKSLRNSGAENRHERTASKRAYTAQSLSFVGGRSRTDNDTQAFGLARAMGKPSQASVLWLVWVE